MRLSTNSGIKIFVLMLGLMLTIGGVARADDDTHHVLERTGSEPLSKDGNPEASGLDAVAGGNIAVPGGMVRVTSSLLKPPSSNNPENEWSFAKFDDNTPRYVDIIHHQIDGFIPSANPDESNQIRVRSYYNFGDLPNADGFPLWAEGNLSPPGGSGGSGEQVIYHWGAKIEGDLTFHVEIVPAEMLDSGASNGRGMVPHIPMNAILPENLSGTDEKAKVRAALRVELTEAAAEDMIFTFNIDSNDPNKATVAPSQIDVTVPQGETIGFSNSSGTSAGEFIITGKTLSSDSSDFVTIRASWIEESDDVISEIELWRYQFVLEIDPQMKGSPTTSRQSIARSGYKPEPVVEGDDFTLWDKVKTMKIVGWQDATENVNVRSHLGPNPLTGSAISFDRSGGSVFAAYPEAKFIDDMVLLAKTSSNQQFLDHDLANPDPNEAEDPMIAHPRDLLSEGNIQEKKLIKSGTFRHMSFPTDVGAAPEFLIEDGGQSDPVDPPHSVQLEVISSGSTKAVGDDVLVHNHTEGTAFMLVTTPKDAFRGDVIAEITADRDAEAELLAYAPHPGVSLSPISLLKSVSVSISGSGPGISFNLGQLYSSIELQDTEAKQSTAGVSYNFTLVMQEGEREWIDNSAQPLPSAKALAPEAFDKPVTVTLASDPNQQQPSQEVHSLNTLTASNDHPFVFRSQTTEAHPTLVLAYTSNVATTRKLDKRGMAWVTVEFSKLDVRLSGDNSPIIYKFE